MKAGSVEKLEDLNSIAAELDSLHAAGRQAFLARDIDAYRALFTEDLRYMQPDGKAIDLKQLIKDVHKQLSRFKAVDSQFTRESILMNDDGTVTQIGSQHGMYSVSAFIIITRTWKIARRGRYTYRKTNQGWRICDVEVLSETGS